MAIYFNGTQVEVRWFEVGTHNVGIRLPEGMPNRNRQCNASDLSADGGFQEIQDAAEQTWSPEDFQTEYLGDDNQPTAAQRAAFPDRQPGDVYRD